MLKYELISMKKNQKNQMQPDIDVLITRMRRLEHFKNLKSEDLKILVNAGRINSIEKGTTIFREDDPCSGIFVLLAGQVYLYKLGPDGQENIMAVVKPIILFNEVAVLDRGVNPVSSVAIEDCLIWRASCEVFNNLIIQYPTLGLGLLPVLAARNRFLITQYEDLSFRSVRARMAKLLLDLSDYGRKHLDRRENSINDMAARISTVPEAVSRSLSEFKNNRLIQSSRLIIEVVDADGLANLAQIGAEFFDL